jgi:hypothetical protein
LILSANHYKGQIEDITRRITLDLRLREILMDNHARMLAELHDLEIQKNPLLDFGTFSSASSNPFHSETILDAEADEEMFVDAPEAPTNV